MTVPHALLAEARKAFHAKLLRETLTINANGVVSNADGSSTPILLKNSKPHKILK
jgi:hypothetical protein